MFTATDDAVNAAFSTEEKALLRQIPWLLGELVDGHADPGYDVLHRPVYADNPSAAEELADLVKPENDQQRTIDCGVVQHMGDGRTTMTFEEAHGFLRAVNDARLVLAARAGVFDDDAEWQENIPRDPALAAVAWLGYVQGELIEALSFATPGRASDR